jgi:hypothetical protein
MLTEEAVEEYWREGYVVGRGLIGEATVGRVLEAAASYGDPAEGSGWTAKVFDHKAPCADRDVHQILWYPGLIETVEQILASEPRVWYGMLAVVAANGGDGLPWHQDNQYTQLVGSALNVFIALTEITPDRANLWVSPRSHLLGTQPARASDLYGGAHREAAIAPENGICLPTLQPGDACIFDRCTYHRSLKNSTDRPRLAYAAQYQADNTRIAATGKRDPLRMRARDLAMLVQNA